MPSSCILATPTTTPSVSVVSCLTYHRQNLDKVFSSSRYMVWWIVLILYPLMNITKKPSVYWHVSHGNQLVMLTFLLYSTRLKNLLIQKSKWIFDRIDNVVVTVYYRQAAHFGTLLEETRRTLSGNDVSIEKCLMLNRWIKWIEQVTSYFRYFLRKQDLVARIQYASPLSSLAFDTIWKQSWRIIRPRTRFYIER